MVIFKSLHDYMTDNGDHLWLSAWEQCALSPFIIVCIKLNAHENCILQGTHSNRNLVLFKLDKCFRWMNLKT